MGRLGDSDFHRLEAGFKFEAAEILQKLDQLGAEGNLDEGIEQAIAARKATLTSRRGTGPMVCPSCGAELASGKKFCADCGRRI